MKLINRSNYYFMQKSNRFTGFTICWFDKSSMECRGSMHISDKSI